MNRRLRKKILKDAGMPPQHVGEMMPPDQLPVKKEYEIGRNDSCPCGRNQEAIKAKDEYVMGLILGTIDQNEFPPFFDIRKYKDCCLTLGEYENYK